MKRWIIVPFVIIAGAAQSKTVTYYYVDPQGTPLAETDSNGNVIAAHDYRPFGKAATGSEPDGRGFTSHVNDPDSGFVYMQARFYDPATGRFLTPDPLGTKAGFNDYAYVGNDPTGKVDPDGLYACRNELSCKTAKALSDGLRTAQSHFSKTSSQYKSLEAKINFLGTKDDGNGVTVIATRQSADTAIGRGVGHKDSGTAELTINLGNVHTPGSSPMQDAVNLLATGAHEIQHAMDDIIEGGPPNRESAEMRHEIRGVTAERPVWQGMGVDDPWGTWTKAGGVNMQRVRDEAKTSTASYCALAHCL